MKVPPMELSFPGMKVLGYESSSYHSGYVTILIFHHVQENRRTHTGKCIDCKLTLT